MKYIAMYKTMLFHDTPNVLFRKRLLIRKHYFIFNIKKESGPRKCESLFHCDIVTHMR